jgi:ParB/RepB/Spo0J family partition protein
MITNLKSISQARTDVHHIDPRKLVDFEGLNERIDFGSDFTELKEDIRLRGVQEPFVVKLHDGQVKVIKGYRRKRAVHELITEKAWKHGTVPVRSEERGATMIDRLVDQITGNIAKPYTILEQGRIFERLQSEGLKSPEIAARTHKTRTHISNALALASAPPAVIAYVEQNKISDSLVIDLIRESDGDNEKLVAAVKAAIETAAASGKEHATRKHAGKKKKKDGDQNPNGETGNNGEDGAGSESSAGETVSTAEEDGDKIVAWLRAGKPQHVSAAAMASALGLGADAVNGAIAVLRTRQVLGEPNQDGLFAVQISFLEGADVQQIPVHRTDWSSVDGNGGSNNAPESLSLDSTKNLVKLNKILEEIPSEESDPVVRNAVEATINFLEGKMDTKAMKSFLRL